MADNDVTELATEPIPDRSDDLRTAVLRVDSLRKALAFESGLLRGARAKFEEQHASTMSRVKLLNESLDESESTLRHLAVLHFERTGSENKAITPGVTITKRVDINYDPAEARAWAIEQGVVDVLQLNKAEFEKVAKSAMRPKFVVVEDGWTAKLAKDLSKALAEADDG